MGLGFHDWCVSTTKRSTLLLSPNCLLHSSHDVIDSHVPHQGTRRTLSRSIASTNGQLSELSTDDSFVFSALDDGQSVFLCRLVAALQMEFDRGLEFISIWCRFAISLVASEYVGAECDRFGGHDLFPSRVCGLWGELKLSYPPSAVGMNEHTIEFRNALLFYYIRY